MNFSPNTNVIIALTCLWVSLAAQTQPLRQKQVLYCLVERVCIRAQPEPDVPQSFSFHNSRPVTYRWRLVFAGGVRCHVAGGFLKRRAAPRRTAPHRTAPHSSTSAQVAHLDESREEDGGCLQEGQRREQDGGGLGGPGQKGNPHLIPATEMFMLFYSQRGGETHFYSFIRWGEQVIVREIPPFLVISGLAGIFQVVQHTKAAGKLNRGGKQLMCCRTGEEKTGEMFGKAR